MTDDRNPLPLPGGHATAIGATVVRAFHLFRESEPKILRDDCALPLSGLSLEAAMAKPFLPRTSAAWVLRGRCPEDRLAAARIRLNQYVILGAGPGSYALREAGFHQIEHFSPEQANDVYLRARDDGLRAPGLERLVSATTG